MKLRVIARFNKLIKEYGSNFYIFDCTDIRFTEDFVEIWNLEEQVKTLKRTDILNLTINYL